MRNLSIEEGTELVHAARNTIELYIKNPYFKKSIVHEQINGFSEPSGVFVTLYHYPTEELRGCIGFPRPVMPLKKAVVEAAAAAAFEDPRFVPVSHKELNDMIVEVSVLSGLKELPGPENKRLHSVKIGRDGLIVEYGIYSGLLLPIVAVEEGWDEERFLNEVCLKAGIPQDYWRHQNVRLYSFTTQVFKEDSPGGKVIQIL
ncbi:TIGR00296 family protein [Candidatus Marsarchaeota archaeon]|nr:TIGR00296 family protein [Candidatus Marsarchaeota archaeon]MCL5404394.1 TIGR00296 family protein [Candidatus Marsarchaeota archaeon]